jgi:hypothetical protein
VNQALGHGDAVDGRFVDDDAPLAEHVVELLGEEGADLGAHLGRVEPLGLMRRRELANDRLEVGQQHHIGVVPTHGLHMCRPPTLVSERSNQHRSSWSTL